MEKIIIKTTVNARVETVWNAYNSAEDIKHWNQASDDWHTISSSNDLRIGGKFKSRMEAKDGSAGFDFEGKYTELVPFKKIAYVMPDGRSVEVLFNTDHNKTNIEVSFDPELANPIQMQRDGWQAILNNFKAYVDKIYQ